MPINSATIMPFFNVCMQMVIRYLYQANLVVQYYLNLIRHKQVLLRLLDQYPRLLLEYLHLLPAVGPAAPLAPVAGLAPVRGGGGGGAGGLFGGGGLGAAGLAEEDGGDEVVEVGKVLGREGGVVH